MVTEVVSDAERIINRKYLYQGSHRKFSEIRTFIVKNKILRPKIRTHKRYAFSIEIFRRDKNVSCYKIKNVKFS